MQLGLKVICLHLIKQGAEAKLFLIEYLGQKAVLKKREHKKYREAELDGKILKERLHTECTLISAAKKAGERTPLILNIDPSEFSLTTEFFEGKTLKQELVEGSSGIGGPADRDYG